MIDDRSHPDFSSRPRLRKGIIWYHDADNNVVIMINRYLQSSQITRRISCQEMALFAKCDGTRSIAQLASELSMEATQIESILTTWHQQAPYMFRWVHSEADDRRQSKVESAATTLFNTWKAATQPTTDNDDYHRHNIHDAYHQFDNIETTVSHAFSHPHKSLGNREYGEAFADKLLEIGALRPGVKLLEVGCGIGRFANSVLNRLRDRHVTIYNTIDYYLFDLSPALQASQRQICSNHDRTHFLHGNIENFDFGDQQFDIVIANEMIADLSISVARNDASAQQPQNDAEALIAQYQLTAATTETFVVNTGAIRLLETVKELLNPGGIAVLTEYGTTDEFPVVVELHGHNEYSIHFGHLLSVAQQLAMQPTLESLGDFLAFDGDCVVLSSRSHILLSHYLLPFLGKTPLPPTQYAPDELRAKLGDIYEQLGNVQFRPLREGGVMNPFDFLALVIRAPQ